MIAGAVVYDTAPDRESRAASSPKQEDCKVENAGWHCRVFGCHWSYSTSDCDVGNALVEYDQWHPEDVFLGTNFDFAILLRFNVDRLTTVN